MNLVGRLIEAAGRDTTHHHLFPTTASARVDNRPLTDSRIGYGQAADWHRKYGILILSGEPFLKNHDLEEASDSRHHSGRSLRSCSDSQWPRRWTGPPDPRGIRAYLPAEPSGDVCGRATRQRYKRNRDRLLEHRRQMQPGPDRVAGQQE